MKLSIVLAACLILAACANLGAGRAVVAESDINMMERTLQLALNFNPDGQVRSWQNAATGHGGSIVPIASYVTEQGVFCRDYSDIQTVGDQETVYVSRACRADGGSWVWVDDVPAPFRVDAVATFSRKIVFSRF